MADPALDLETALRLLRELTAPAEDLATLPAERIRALFEAERLLRDHETNLVARQARDIRLVEIEQALAIANARAVAERKAPWPADCCDSCEHGLPCACDDEPTGHGGGFSKRDAVP